MYRIVIILMICCVHISRAQDITRLEGRVLDAVTNQAIAGAAVTVDRSTVSEQTGVAGQLQQSVLGAITDSKGEFVLEIPNDVKAVTISFMGYESLRVGTYQGRKTFLLQPADEALEEVIVTGYSDIKKRKNTTAYTKIDAEKIKQSGVASIEQMLEGQIPGMQFSNLSGGPNGVSQIRIRGTVSMNGTQDPLWVVDGLPVEGTELPNRLDKDDINTLRNLPIAGLNPEDIKDITVLKDAAATAIYGARAANGVIVITTKRGQAGPAKVSVSANTFVTQRPDFDRLNLMNASQKVDFELEMAKRADLTYRSGKGAIARLLTSADEWDTFRAGGLTALSAETRNAIDALRGQEYNWADNLFRNAINQQYNASVSGGTESHRYYLSAGYFDEKGSTYNVDMNRCNITLNNDFRINSRLTAGVNLLGSITNRHNPIQDQDAFTNPSYYAHTVNPYLAIRNEDGSYVYDPDIEGYEGDTYIPFNAMEERENTKYSLSNKALKAISYLQYDILHNLNIRTELGLQFDEVGSEKFMDQDSYYRRKMYQRTRYYSGGEKYFLPEGGIIENTANSSFQYNWKSFLSYNTMFGERHELDVMGGTELRRSKNTLISTKGFGFNPVTLTTKPLIFPTSDFANQAIYRQYAKGINETSYASFFANATYTLDRKYNLFGSIRYDGSNMFGVDPKYRFLPIWSLAGSWIVTEESFMEAVPAISNLRLRASYGIQGNVDRNTYPFFIGQYSTGMLLPGSNEETIVVDMPANDKLRWERTQTWNAGLDIGLWSDRLNVTVDYYNRNSTDVIGVSQLALENGFENIHRNWAAVKNEGIELMISSRNIVRDRFEWGTDFNIAHNNNKLTKVLADPKSYILDNQEGYPINSIFVLPTAGLDADGLMQFQGADGETVAFEEFYGLYDPWADFLPGYMVATELTPDTYRSKFRYLGNADPKFVGGMTNRFRFDHFDLAVSAAFNLDRWMRATPPYNPASVDRGMNQSNLVMDALNGGGLPALGSTNIEDNARWIAYSWMMDNDPVKSFGYYDIWAKNMSYVRINSIRLGYTMPSKIAKRIGAGNIRFNVEGRNLFVFGDSYDGYFDPETYGNFYAQPITKSFTFGLSAQF
ncbi:SusC/RagA family TonB-linked outer membrane protein [Sphingobacterium corticibacterium]|uniref:SusC/RagA family TonB-linked outer membrane protein n=1 Tax=Sphingobacterium corticibacterium TaxID=2484746 RepID=A0A4Q6XQY9_9SPHI|nr:SusC/RagA family TonB-linked outer membrane protein [Sphingobacterium corticibacterium]RZF62165.1 SusC/RagA family TonB-linked outer membrane protein [Sphingobacterium corticibacterium]